MIGMRQSGWAVWICSLWLGLIGHVHGEDLRLDLSPEMIDSEGRKGDPTGLIDEQRAIIGPPVGTPSKGWEIPSQFWKEFPHSVTLDLKETKKISRLWLFDTNGEGEVLVSSGSPENWEQVGRYDCKKYLAWAEIPIDTETRYLRITRMTPGANFSEIALYEHTDASWDQLQTEKNEAARAAAQREAMLIQAKNEALRRPIVTMEPFGRLSLVDEIDPTLDTARESPENCSRIEAILGRPARVMNLLQDEASFMTWRIGRNKLLRPGAAYVLAIDYPEDVDRSWIVINTGNESSRGFHTGRTVGDAFHSKYVNSLPESVSVPLSQQWQTWTLLFHLHDRFAETGLLRGPLPRPLAPEDGFDVTISQFSAPNIPLSAGAAVGKIRLYEVIDEEQLVTKVSYPPDPLPRRRLFWREEMADGVIERKNNEKPGITTPIEWYRHKAKQIQFLGMNTFSKDLLEFGACQHWDSTPHGGHDWVFFDEATKSLWPEIVTLMGQHGLDVLPYYEYAGSRGYKGLGNQKRSRPLTRNDAYTHISWVEEANADLTDPETLADFCKMLDVTVTQHSDQANFVGVWLRPRSQMPVSFSDDALKRFSSDLKLKSPATREAIKSDKVLYQRYINWWNGKRKDFLLGVRQYLLDSRIKEPTVLWTGCPSEPGVSFPSWDPTIVVDEPGPWADILKQPDHVTSNGRIIRPVPIDEVVSDQLYRKALQSPGMNWGDWEVQHAQPADDPAAYRQLPGLMMTHAFNRNYTVTDPETMSDFRSVSGLAMIRHYSLNEHMMFDKKDQQKMNYFVCDVERAGPACMMAETLAIANGDPTMIGYLVGSNIGRGFPEYVQRFNSAFLSLPALESSVDAEATDRPEVVVRRIRTSSDGTWLAVVNTSAREQKATIRTGLNQIENAATGVVIPNVNGTITLELPPYSLTSLHGR
jgi:hypothetical protein